MHDVTNKNEGLQRMRPRWTQKPAELLWGDPQPRAAPFQGAIRVPIRSARCDGPLGCVWPWGLSGDAARVTLPHSGSSGNSGPTAAAESVRGVECEMAAAGSCSRRRGGMAATTAALFLQQRRSAAAAAGLPTQPRVSDESAAASLRHRSTHAQREAIGHPYWRTQTHTTTMHKKQQKEEKQQQQEEEEDHRLLSVGGDTHASPADSSSALSSSPPVQSQPNEPRRVSAALSCSLLCAAGLLSVLLWTGAKHLHPAPATGGEWIGMGAPSSDFTPSGFACRVVSNDQTNTSGPLPLSAAAAAGPPPSSPDASDSSLSWYDLSLLQLRLDYTTHLRFIYSTREFNAQAQAWLPLHLQSDVLPHFRFISPPCDHVVRHTNVKRGYRPGSVDLDAARRVQQILQTAIEQMPTHIRPEYLDIIVDISNSNRTQTAPAEPYAWLPDTDPKIQMNDTSIRTALAKFAPPIFRMQWQQQRRETDAADLFLLPKSFQPRSSRVRPHASFYSSCFIPLRPQFFLFSAALVQYSRRLRAPWTVDGDAGRLSVFRRLDSLLSTSRPPLYMGSAACNLDVAYLSSCGCHPCVESLGVAPRDFQLLFPEPFPNDEQTANLNRQLDAAAAHIAAGTRSDSMDTLAEAIGIAMKPLSSRNSLLFASPPLWHAPAPFASLPVGRRVAVVFSGTLRSFASAYPWLHYHLLSTSAYVIHLFLHVYNEVSPDGSSMAQRVERIFSFHNQSSLAGPFKVFFTSNDDSEVPASWVQRARCRQHYEIGHTTTVSLESARRAHRLKRIEEVRQREKYFMVIKLRYDVLPRVNWWPAIEAALKDHRQQHGDSIGFVFSPTCRHWYGVNDQVFIGDSDSMHSLLERGHFGSLAFGFGLAHYSGGGLSWWPFHPEHSLRHSLDFAISTGGMFWREVRLCYSIVRPRGAFKWYAGVQVNAQCKFDDQPACCRQEVKRRQATPDIVQFSPSDPQAACLPGETEAACMHRRNATGAC